MVRGLAFFLLLLLSQHASDVYGGIEEVEVGGTSNAPISSRVDGAAEQLFALPVQGHGDLLLHVGDDPCTAIQSFCAEVDFETSQCERQMVRAVQNVLDRMWTEVRLKVNETDAYYCGCRKCSFGKGVRKASAQSKLSKKLLGLLRKAISSRDSKSPYLADYNAQRLSLPDEDRVAHFRKALELVPNAPFIIDQLGLALNLAGRRRTATLLYENAVARGIWANVDQRPLSKHVAGLETRPWHDASSFAFTALLSSHFVTISREYVESVSSLDRPLPSQDEGIHTGGTWSEFVLKKHNVVASNAVELFPRTMALLHDISTGAGAFEGNEVDIFNAKFSILSPGTHVRPHCGPTNARLRAHLAIQHAGGAHIRVRDETRTWEEGRVMVFDDSFEHEVWHNGTEPRVVLIMDFWHPDLPLDKRDHRQYGGG